MCRIQAMLGDFLPDALVLAVLEGRIFTPS
jgi:hypothetical protein